MGAGRKTETFNVSERSTGLTNAPPNSSAPARNLRKSDLGGVIFGCKNHTIKECLSKQMFGLPGPHFPYVVNIEPGLPLFLFNYSDRMLHGVFEAASHGQMGIDPYAWTENGKERTSFPAQVRIHINTYCQPLAEKHFKPVIKDNYYSHHLFWFELDHAQVKGLTSLFRPTPLNGNTRLPPGALSRNNLSMMLPATKKEIEPWSGSTFHVVQPDSTGDAKKNPKSFVSLFGENKYASLLWDDGDSEQFSSSKTSSSCLEDGETRVPVSDWKELDQENVSFYSGLDMDVANPTGLDKPSYKEVVSFEKEMVLQKLKSLAADHKFSSISPMKCVVDSDIPFASGGTYEDCEQFPKGPSVLAEEETTVTTNLHSDKAELKQVLKELQEVKERTSILEKQQVESEAQLEQLKNLMMESDRKNQQLLAKKNRKIQKLKERVTELDLKLDPSMVLEARLNESLVEDPEKLIYLVGGFDGNSWLSALDSYSPSLDILTALRPMSSERSYASATALNGCIYVFGGGDGSSWYDTAECYQPGNDEWTLCPPLAQPKGSLAGATLNGKIFAIGGGNGKESFSDVEMFDPLLGRWINNQPMNEKRFALAAAEMFGVIFVAGGFDGSKYLMSAERFDPREASGWSRLPSMTMRRGCLSLAVLNEKLYALGGYDGDNMVSDIEVFDPRANSWLKGEPMQAGRGYAAAAVLGDSLFVIGGMRQDSSIVDTVECYKESSGWLVTGLKAIGKRSFLSAVIL